MGYWGSGPVGSDFGFNAISLIASMIKDKMDEKAKVVIDKSYPEQAIVAYVKCLRLIAAEFPDAVSIGFRKKHLKQAKTDFENWYGAVKSKIPSKYREALYSEAMAEFQLFEEQLGVKQISHLNSGKG